MSLSNEQVIQGTLDWCNIRREEQGKEPLEEMPKGSRQNPLDCPCGVASGVAVGSSIWVTAEEYARSGGDVGSLSSFSAAYRKFADGTRGDLIPERRLPHEVAIFVRRFDEGRLPQFDINGAVEE